MIWKTLICLVLLSSLARALPLHFATRAEGRAALCQPDAFVTAQSGFDRAARLHSPTPVDEKTYLAYVAEQVQDWSEPEKERLAQAAARLEQHLATYGVRLPNPIVLIKTSGQEEGGAAYCRGTATIVLPAKMLEQAHGPLDGLLAHELFHLITRAEASLRRQLYALVGFAPCAPLQFPAELKERAVTNPDAFDHAFVARLQVGGVNRPIIPILLAKKEPYTSGDFFPQVELKLLVVDLQPGSTTAALQQGHTILLDPSQVPDYVEHLGRNTGYIIDPEEVLAENFALLASGAAGLATVPTPKLLEDLERILRSAAGGVR